ncbi:lycopene cyclase family protein [Actinomycetes bacterium M1A6_2h]
MTTFVDLAVVGLGPAGRALAHRALVHGASVAVVDPHPDRRWTPTYAAWSDEIPAWLPATSRATETATPSVWGTRPRVLNRPYTVLDTAALQHGLALDGAELIRGSATELNPDRITLADGTTVRARVVVDARGTPPGAGIPEQTAYGIVVSPDIARRVSDDAPAWIMDWRDDNGTDGSSLPSFLYVVPLSENRILLEETCLIGSPALDFAELRSRLTVRLSGRGYEVTGDEPVERVRFAVRPPPGDASGVLRFGARGGLMHPATGYSVAASLSLADSMATDIAGGRIPRVGSRRSAAVSKLRSLGSSALTGLPHDSVATFFDAFFDLPIERQRAYLSGRDDLVGVGVAMASLFGGIDTSSRLAIARALGGGKLPGSAPRL